MGIGKAPSIRAANTDVTPVKKKSPTPKVSWQRFSPRPQDTLEKPLGHYTFHQGSQKIKIILTLGQPFFIL